MGPLLSKPVDSTVDSTTELVTPEFEVFLLNEEDVATALKNLYILQLSEHSFLSILQPKRAKRAFQSDDREKQCFHLFIGQSFFEASHSWTNDNLITRGKKSIPFEMFLAYVGLEIAMSLLQIGSIKQYWETVRFSGHGDFCNTMSHNDFQTIHGAIKFHPPNAYNEDLASKDPLWHSHHILEHFQRQCASVAVPCATLALDENSCRTSAWTKAKSYMPMKPIKYGIRFYVIVSTRELYCHSLWDNGSRNELDLTPGMPMKPIKYGIQFYVIVSTRELYCHSLWDNGSGNELDSTPGGHYTVVFHDLRLPFEKTFRNDPNGKLLGIPKDSASALWCLQMSHQSKKMPNPSGYHSIFMDNFYTHHILAE